MLNELFEILPEYVAFQILTYCPHPDAVLIKEFWRIHYLWKHLHNYGMRRVTQDIDRINAEMIEFNEETNCEFRFMNWYLYNVSPQAFNNQENGDGFWYME